MTYENELINLTPKEFLMIGHFMENSNQVFSREYLIELIWGFGSNTEGGTVDSYVRNMRDKIRQAKFPIDEHFGYKWGN